MLAGNSAGASGKRVERLKGVYLNFVQARAPANSPLGESLDTSRHGRRRLLSIENSEKRKIFARFARFARLALTILPAVLYRRFRAQPSFARPDGPKAGSGFRVPGFGFSRPSSGLLGWGERPREPACPNSGLTAREDARPTGQPSFGVTAREDARPTPIPRLAPHQ